MYPQALVQFIEWIDSNNDSYTLRLQLRTTGAFYGYSARWIIKLLFSFRNPTQAVSGSKPLGKRIVIDPGHGGRLSEPQAVMYREEDESNIRVVAA